MRQLPEAYLSGIELFNAGRFYECHEAWEEIWLRAEGIEREFLHAMIQTAAALLHRERGNLKGANSLARRALMKLAALPPVVLRLSIGEFARQFERAFEMAPDSAPPRIELISEGNQA